MVKYEYKHGLILKDGHTMFLEDVIKDLNNYAQKNEEAPETIDNKQKFQCLCEIDMLSGLGAPILQINKECPQHGHYCEA